ncbi:hypothetical protein [Labrys neptuniae]
MELATHTETTIRRIKAKAAPDPRELFQVYVPGATSEEIERGWLAAFEVFKEAKCHPLTAAAGLFAVEEMEFSSNLKPYDPNEPQPKVDPEAIVTPDPATVWLKADAAAAKAICEGWRKPSDTANLAVDTRFEDLVAEVDEGIARRGGNGPER